MNRSNALVGGLCLMLALAYQQPGLASEASVATENNRSQQESCVADPPDSYRQAIVGTFDGEPAELVVSARFGGAVESFTWRGKEFINIWDHGRQISYAWGMDGYGECLNPTEPGSAADYQSLSSTTQVEEICQESEARLTTRVHPAFWLGPGESGFCAGGATTAVNENRVSGQTLEKTIAIGYKGLENVIAFTASITLERDYRSNQLEIPTAYLRHEFSMPYRFNPITGELTSPESQTVHEPWSYEHFDGYPPILATTDGEYAFAAYSAEDIVGYGLHRTGVANPEDRTNKWNIVIREEPAPAGTYTYRSFAIFGTLDDVTRSLSELYDLHPVDFAPPEGYLDVADCDEIAGWAWDPKAPNEPIAIEIYSESAEGELTLLASGRADRVRKDLPPILGDNGEHGYRFETEQVLPDGERHRLRIFAVNSNEALPSAELEGSGEGLECPALSPTEAPTPTLRATALAAEGQGQAPEAGRRLPCLGGLLTLLGPAAIVGLNLRRTGRAEHGRPGPSRKREGSSS